MHLRRFLKTAFEKVLKGFLEDVWRCALQGGRVLRRVLRRGSEKGLSRRHLEGRNTPFREYDPIGVRPTGTVPLHTLGGTLQQEPCNANVPSGLVPGLRLCRPMFRHSWVIGEGQGWACGTVPLGRGEKTPQDKVRRKDFTKHPRPLY